MSAKPSFLRRERQEAIKNRQRRQAHRQRLALGRALHQVLALKFRWMDRWNNHQRPARIKLPRMVRQHKRRIYRAFMHG